MMQLNFINACAFIMYAGKDFGDRKYVNDKSMIIDSRWHSILYKNYILF